MRAWASGKLILLGEHAVVHGEPAIAFSVSLGMTVTLDRLPNPSAPNALGDLTDDALLRAAVATALGPTGWRVTFQTDLPLGRGMGSSAALSTALIRARREALGLPPGTIDEQFAEALAVETVFHANPSGLDVAVSVRGGILHYRRTSPPTFRALPLPPWQVVVLDTGKAGSTKALVAGVTARRPAIDPLLQRIGQLVPAAEAHLHDPKLLGALLHENQCLLRGIGVSTAEVDALCDLATAAGAYGAKLSGAGGGGVVLALVDDPAPVLRAAARAGVPAWTCRPVEAP